MTTIRKFTLAAAFAGLLAALPAATQAQSQSQPQPWPQRGVKFILPFGPGSATDIAARLIGDKLAAKWGKPVVVENRPGADGLLAINAFTAAADDHVLLYASSASFIAHPYTQEKVPYDMERDLAPIARVSDTVLSAAVPAASGYKTLREFVEGAKQAPDKHNFAGAAGPAGVRRHGVREEREPRHQQDPLQGCDAGRARPRREPHPVPGVVVRGGAAADRGRQGPRGRGGRAHSRWRPASRP